MSLISTIGEGQFGDVHKGAFKDEVGTEKKPKMVEFSIPNTNLF